MDKKIRIAIYNEHCALAGRPVCGRDGEESDDWTVYEGTAAELLEDARDQLRCAAASGAGSDVYHLRVARSICADIGARVLFLTNPATKRQVAYAVDEAKARDMLARVPRDVLEELDIVGEDYDSDLELLTDAVAEDQDRVSSYLLS